MPSLGLPHSVVAMLSEIFDATILLQETRMGSLLPALPLSSPLLSVAITAVSLPAA